MSRSDQSPTTKPAERIMGHTMIPLPMVTRVEVIDHSPDGEGRVWTKWNLSNALLSLQDEGRTLKVFVK